MTYEKQTWKTGDVITAEKLNHIEEGIALAKIPSADDDVLFYDYDGSLVKSYSKDDFLALTAFPENPTHEGLTAQGWNWSFEGAKSYVEKYGKLVVGQMYVTEDGKTRLYIQKYDPANLSVSFTISTGTVKVDWGDGSAEDTCDSTNAPSHTYAETGDYVITMSVVSDEYTFKIQSVDLHKVEIGNGISTIMNSAFAECEALQTITLHSGISEIQYKAFSDCFCLGTTIIPRGVTSINESFSDCYPMGTISLPDTLESSNGGPMFDSCYALSIITIPETMISDKRANGFALGTCFSLKTLIIPTSIMYFAEDAFEACYSLNELHLKSQIPPTAPSNFSNNKNMRIIVPYSEDHSVLNAYKTATGWSDYASQIYEEAV